MTKQVSSPRRRWTQFSLRTLLTIMLVAAAFLAGRTSVQPELERLKAAERLAVGQCLEERLKREDAEGALMVAKERIRTLVRHTPSSGKVGTTGTDFPLTVSQLVTFMEKRQQKVAARCRVCRLPAQTAHRRKGL